MKKIILSGIMAVTLIASTTVMAQDVTTSKVKKETKKEVKTEAKKEETKATDKKTDKTKKTKKTNYGKSQMKPARKS